MNTVKPSPGDMVRGPFRFGDIVVDPAAHSLLRAGIEQPVEPKAFTVLLALLRHSGELVNRDDLINQVWGHQHVTPGVLTRVIAQLRHALDDDSHHPRYILTRHALGYCFIGTLLSGPEAAATAESIPGADRAHVHPDTWSTPPCDTVPGPSPRPTRALATPETSPDRAFQSWFGWKSLGLVAIVLTAVVTIVWIQRQHPPPSPVPVPVKASIAVLPFTSLSRDSSNDYFTEGLTEEMRNALANVPGLKVAAAITPAVRKSAGDAKALGARLGVASILEASVRREGQSIRVSARLSDTRTGFTLWSQTYEHKLSGIFATQTTIAREVVHALLGSIPGSGQMLETRLTPTRNTAAFDAYLKGLHLLQHPTQAGALNEASRQFEQALKKDHAFALAQAKICQLQVWNFESGHSAAAFDKARAACQRAVQLGPSLGEVALAQGDLYRVRGDFPRALAYYRSSAKTRALRVRAHVGMAQTYAAQGQQGLALAQFRKALELNPDDASVHAQLGYQQYFDGHVPQAIASYRKAVQLQPENAGMWGTLGALYMEAGNNTDAAQALQHALAIEPNAATLSNLGLLKYQAGDYPAAVALQRRATRLDPQDFMYWGNLGDALRADPAASQVEVHDAYQQATTRVEHYLKLKPDDARAVAALANYRAILHDPASARALLQQSEALGSQSGEVALLNAETLGLLGELDAARKRIATARAAGIPETLITSNHTLRRLGLLSPSEAADTPRSAQSTAPGADKGR